MFVDDDDWISEYNSKYTDAVFLSFTTSKILRLFITFSYLKFTSMCLLTYWVYDWTLSSVIKLELYAEYTRHITFQLTTQGK
jgi:hypothetical protein